MSLDVITVQRARDTQKYHSLHGDTFTGIDMNLHLLFTVPELPVVQGRTFGGAMTCTSFTKAADMFDSPDGDERRVAVVAVDRPEMS